MQYQKILPGIFLSRPNRFVARVEVDGAEAVCHVKIPAAAGSCWSPAPGSTWRRAGSPGARQTLI